MSDMSEKINKAFDDAPIDRPSSWNGEEFVPIVTPVEVQKAVEAEREACAQIAEDEARDWAENDKRSGAIAADQVAQHIRLRDRK